MATCPYFLIIPFQQEIVSRDLGEIICGGRVSANFIIPKDPIYLNGVFWFLPRAAPSSSAGLRKDEREGQVQEIILLLVPLARLNSEETLAGLLGATIESIQFCSGSFSNKTSTLG